MKKIRYFVYIVVCCFSWLNFIFFLPGVYAEESFDDTVDCTDVSVDYLEDSTLTQEERLRLMDKAFFQSLNKFELCQEAKKIAKAAGGSNGGGGGSGAAGAGGNNGNAGDDAGGLAGEAGGMSSTESIASSAMSGTEAPQKYPLAEGFEAGDTSAEQRSSDGATAGSKTGGNMQSSNGKLPDDIPPAKNDDALAAQIRYAAENESDPEKSKQLWNEYRKYKGLPTK